MGRILRRGVPLLGALFLVVVPPSAGATGLGESASPPAAVAMPDSYSVNEDESLQVDAPGVLANDSPMDSTCVVSTDTSSLAGTLQAQEYGAFTFTPNANFHGETSFTYGIRLETVPACAGDPESTALVTITVQSVNDPPTANADAFQGLVNRTLNVPAPGVLRNDADVDGDSLTAQKVSNPAHGTVVLAADGAFSYTPTSGYVGPDAFSYRASDGSANSATRIVTLTVTALPPTPAPTPVPTPTSAPTPSPAITASPVPSDSLAPSASLDASSPASASPAPSASIAPGATPAPDPTGEGGGPSLGVFAVLILLAALVAFGAAVYVPKWLQQQRTGEPSDVDGP